MELEKKLRALVTVKDDLRQLYKEDVALLHRSYLIQNRTIELLQSMLYKVTSTESEGMGKGEKGIAASSTKPDFILKDEATWDELNELNDQLSNKDSGKKKILRRLRSKEKSLENVIQQLETNGTSKRDYQNCNAGASSLAAGEVKDLVQIIENNFKCSICQEIPVKMVLTDCNHVFCDKCFTDWEGTCKPLSPTCPNCRNLPVQCLGADIIVSFLADCAATLLQSAPVLKKWLRKRQAMEESNLNIPATRRRVNAGNECAKCRGSVNGTTENGASTPNRTGPMPVVEEDADTIDLSLYGHDPLSGTESEDSVSSPAMTIVDLTENDDDE